MNRNEIKSSSDLYLYKAIVDLNSARFLLKAFESEELEIDIEKIYFELQQCAEKLLKAALSKKGIEFKKLHDIEYLIELCRENGIDLVDGIDTLIELSDYAVDGRYALIHDDMNESEKYITILKKLILEIQSAN